MTTIQNLLPYWWILIPVLIAVFHKAFFRFFGIIVIQEDKMGIVTKKFVLGSGKNLPDGQILALSGEAGIQAQTLGAGIYYWMWPWQYDIEIVSFTVIPTGSIGLIAANDGCEIPIGAILGREVPCDSFQDAAAFMRNGGQKGKQAKILQSGTYRINTKAFNIQECPLTVIKPNMVGIVTALDGKPLAKNEIAGHEIDDHNNFQNFDKFLLNSGNRGLQPQVIQSGTYALNHWAVSIEQTNMTEVPVGCVGVVVSYIGDEGKDISGDEFKHGNIVTKGQKGVWSEPLSPGKYALNKYTMKVEVVPTTNIVLNWANAKTESHKLDENLSTISVRSKDGFTFNLDISQIINVPYTEAPKVISRFGTMTNLISQVLEPTIGNYFRNSAQGSEVIEFLNSRSVRQSTAKEHINAVLSEYNVNGVDTLIGDIVPPEALMKTLSARKIAEEEEKTFGTKKKAEESRQAFEREKAISDMQGEMVKANQGIEIADRHAQATVKQSEGQAKTIELQASANAKSVELAAQGAAKATIAKAEAEAQAITLKGDADAHMTKVTGLAEAEKIEAIGQATAKSYKDQASAVGQENFTKMQVVRSIADGHIKLIPDTLIMGGGNGGGNLENMMGLQLLKELSSKKVETPVKQIKGDSVIEIKETKEEKKK